MAICKTCESEFTLKPRHKGLATVCPNCYEQGTEVEPLMMEVSWAGKHERVQRITDAKTAMAFNRLGRRNGCGPLAGIIQGRESYVGRESSKSGSGAEMGAMYFSNLGEKRHTKR